MQPRLRATASAAASDLSEGADSDLSTPRFSEPSPSSTVRGSANVSAHCTLDGVKAITVWCEICAEHGNTLVSSFSRVNLAAVIMDMAMALLGVFLSAGKQ